MTGELSPRDIERVNKLTPWIRELIINLQTKLAAAERSAESVDHENDRLRDIIKGKYGGTGPDSDTVFMESTTEAEIPLGDGATVRFLDQFDVRVENSALLIETTNAQLQILPQSPYLIAVK